jgi:hypothetical protein
MDGDIDYSKYSRAQLEEALSRIDSARYPQNFARLQRELQMKPPEPLPAREPPTILGLIGAYAGALLALQFIAGFIFTGVTVFFEGQHFKLEELRKGSVILTAAASTAAFLVYLHLAKHHLALYIRVALGVAIVVSVITAFMSARPIPALFAILIPNLVIGTLAGSFISVSGAKAPANSRSSGSDA